MSRFRIKFYQITREITHIDESLNTIYLFPRVYNFCLEKDSLFCDYMKEILFQKKYFIKNRIESTNIAAHISESFRKIKLRSHIFCFYINQYSFTFGLVHIFQSTIIIK